MTEIQWGNVYEAMDHRDGKSEKAGRGRGRSHFTTLETESKKTSPLPGRLCAVLILACLGLMGYSYYLVDSSIPSVIHVRAESEESLELRIPARGEIVNVSRQGNSNIPNGAVTIDLSRPLT